MITRKNFLTSVMAASAAAGLNAAGKATSASCKRQQGHGCCGGGGFAPLELKRIRIDAGAERPFKAIQVTDTHLTRVDASENDERKMKLAARRYPMMGFGEYYLSEAVFRARNENVLLLHTGDMYDFVSNANLDLSKRYFTSGDWFAAVGNHEFSRYVGEAKENTQYKSMSAGRVSAVWPNEISFASRVVNGVNFVAVDDVYYNFTGKQLELMEKEVKKGLPIVMMCHVPIHLPRHYEVMMKLTNGVCSYGTGVPDELIATWRKKRDFPAGEEWRDPRVQQRADAATMEFIRYLKAQSLLKAILCGHTHRFWQEQFSPTAVQYICAATYQGRGYMIDFA